MKKLAITVAMLLIMLLSIAHGEIKKTTNINPIDLHSGPNVYSSVIFEIPSQSPIEVLGENAHSGFVFIKTLEGKTGWISNEYIQSSIYPQKTSANHNTLLDKIYYFLQDTWTTLPLIAASAISLIYQIQPFHLFCCIIATMVLFSGILIGLLWGKRTQQYRLRWQ